MGLGLWEGLNNWIAYFAEGGFKEALKIWRFEEKKVVPSWRCLGALEYNDDGPNMALLVSG